MNQLTQSEIFFFISSMGFTVLWILGVIFLIYLIKTMHTFSRIMKQVEKDIDKIGDTTKEMLEDIQDSNAYRFLFGKKKRKNKKGKSEK